MLTPPTGADLDGVWWWRPATGRTWRAGKLQDNYPGDNTPAVIYQNHPHGPALDLMDGTFDYHENLPEIPGEFFHKAEKYYMDMAFIIVSNAIREEIIKNEGLTWARLEGRDIVKRFNADNIGWEVISQEEAEIRYWGSIGGHLPMKNEYRIGFTLRFETGQPEPYGIQDVQQPHPIDEFVDNPTLVGDVIVVPVE